MKTLTIVISVVAAFLISIGGYLLLLNAFRVPLSSTVHAVSNILKQQKAKHNGIELKLQNLAIWISKHIHLNAYKRETLQAELQSARMTVSPELYSADCIVKALLIGVLALPSLLLSFWLSALILILAYIYYRIEYRKVTFINRERREKIEFEMPRLVFTIKESLRHTRDVLYMLELHRKYAGPELENELAITSADMRTGNFDEAIRRLESRVCSPMMSDICSGLITILHGSDNAIYWDQLEIRFADMVKQKLKRIAMKRPSKVKYLSMALLATFCLIFFVVIIVQLVENLSIMFG